MCSSCSFASVLSKHIVALTESSSNSCAPLVYRCTPSTSYLLSRTTTLSEDSAGSGSTGLLSAESSGDGTTAPKEAAASSSSPLPRAPASWPAALRVPSPAGGGGSSSSGVRFPPVLFVHGLVGSPELHQR